MNVTDVDNHREPTDLTGVRTVAAVVGTISLLGILLALLSLAFLWDRLALWQLAISTIVGGVCLLVWGVADRIERR